MVIKGCSISTLAPTESEDYTFRKLTITGSCSIRRKCACNDYRKEHCIGVPSKYLPCAPPTTNDERSCRDMGLHQYYGIPWHIARVRGVG